MCIYICIYIYIHVHTYAYINKKWFDLWVNS